MEIKENKSYILTPWEFAASMGLIDVGNLIIPFEADCYYKFKEYLRKIFSSCKEKVVDIVDDNGEYERLKNMGGLLAWNMIKYKQEAGGEAMNTDTTIAKNIRVADEKASYDAACKRLL